MRQEEGQHRSYTALADEFIEQARWLGLSVRRLGLTDGYPIWLARPEVLNPALRNVLVLAGFHGIEPAGCYGLLRFMKGADRSLLQQVNVSFSPCMNPWGFENDSRYGKDGGYTNSMYEKMKVTPVPSTLPLFENREEISELASFCSLDLHENVDADTKTFYLYAVHGRGEGTEEVVQAAYDAAARHYEARPDGRYQDKYQGAEPYEIKNGTVWDLYDETWDWYVARELGAMMSLVFETPSAFGTLAERIAAQADLVQAVLAQAAAKSDGSVMARELITVARLLLRENG